jgi:hypothetical protein
LHRDSIGGSKRKRNKKRKRKEKEKNNEAERKKTKAKTTPPRPSAPKLEKNGIANRKINFKKISLKKKKHI